MGEKITKENIRSIRPGFGLHPKYYNDIIGKEIRKDVDKGTRLSWNLIKNGRSKRKNTGNNSR
jgi:pseudaminic acid synthase